MKIRIEIDDADSPGMTRVLHDAEPSSTSLSSVPPEVGARALALGASNAGAAPSELPRAGAPPVPAAIAGLATAPPVAGPGDGAAISAGAASANAPQIPSQTVEQDPEAPSVPDEAN
jgi:hypothetical protein